MTSILLYQKVSPLMQILPNHWQAQRQQNYCTRNDEEIALYRIQSVPDYLNRNSISFSNLNLKK